MRNILISLVSTLVLIVLVLAVIPVFVSTGFLKEQVEQFVKDQSGMRLDIQGDVSLSLLTGLSLSAETVSLKDADNKPLFAIDRLDFGLALSPLLSGKADITGITLNKPVFTLSPPSTSPIGSAQNTANAAPNTNQSATANEPIDLSALSLRRLTLRDAQLVSIDEGGHSKILFSGLDAILRIPDFNGPAELSGTLPYKDRDNSFSGTISHVGNAINGLPTGLMLDVSSDLLKAKLEGNLALKGQQLLVANYAANAGNPTQLFNWLGASPAPISVGKMGFSGSIILEENEVRLPSVNLSLDDQTLQGAARIHTGSWLERPFIRVALDASTLNLDALLPQSSASQSSAGPTGSETNIQDSSNTPPDLSALATFDMTLDLRAGRLTYQNKSIRQIKLLSHLFDGNLTADLKSANIAKGNVQARLDGDLRQLIWQGAFKAQQLDIKELATLGGQKSPLSGVLSSDFNFAAQGLSSDQILKKGNIAGVVTLDKGKLSHPALQAAIPDRESGSLTNLTSRVTITSLESPVDIKGNLVWNGENLRYASNIGLGEALKGAPIPASLSVDAKPVSLALSGLINPAQASLSGSKLSLQSASSRALLSWLGQKTTKGTPDVPIALSTRLALAPQQTSLNDLSLQLGQSKGNGSVTYTASGTTSGKPSLKGKLAFETLDVTPFMGNGSEQGRTAPGGRSSAKAKSTGWDTSPIDFSGLNTLDADLAFSAKSLVARDIVTGPVSMIAKLQNGLLTGSLDQLSLYSGQGTGGVTVDARIKPAKMTANFALTGMQMANFLSDSIGLKSLSGTGGVKLDLTTTGSNQAEIIQQLDGTGNLDIRDGQIKGINIPQMLRSLKGNILEGWASSESQSTDFSALTASFVFNKGVVSNSDLLMQSPLLRLTGAGSVDLPNQRIDYKATPKLISKLEGQGALVDANGLPIPIIIKGKLAKPRIYPDIPGILENPQAILKSLEQLGGAGKATSKGIQKIEKTVTKELKKQSEKLGIDLNKLVNPQNNQDDQSGQNNTQKPANTQQQLFKNLTKGLFGN